MKATFTRRYERMVSDLGEDAKITPVKENFDQSGQVTATAGEHFHPPSQAQASANTHLIYEKEGMRGEPTFITNLPSGDDKSGMVSLGVMKQLSIYFIPEP